MGNGNTTTTAWVDLDRAARIEAVVAATVAGLARGWQLYFTSHTGELPTRELPDFDEDTTIRFANFSTISNGLVSAAPPLIFETTCCSRWQRVQNPMCWR
jgi:hypothetical protein